MKKNLVETARKNAEAAAPSSQAQDVLPSKLDKSIAARGFAFAGLRTPNLPRPALFFPEGLAFPAGMAYDIADALENRQEPIFNRRQLPPVRQSLCALTMKEAHRPLRVLQRRIVPLA